jgi:hypothetical protein
MCCLLDEDLEWCLLQSVHRKCSYLYLVMAKHPMLTQFSMEDCFASLLCIVIMQRAIYLIVNLIESV